MRINVTNELHSIVSTGGGDGSFSFNVADNLQTDQLYYIMFVMNADGLQHRYDEIALTKKADGRYDTDSAKQFALENINMSLGQASEHYCKCGFKKFKGIMDNIVYLGLPNFRIINKKKTWKEKNKITEI